MDKDAGIPDHGEVLDKLDALLNKHRAPLASSQPTAAPLASAPVTEMKDAGSAIPTLTEIAERAVESSAIPTLTEIAATPEPAAETAPLTAPALLPPAKERFGAMHADLDRIIAETLERRIVPQLTQHLDQSLENLLAQLKEEIAHLVRESLAQELQQYLDTIVNDLQHHDSGNR